MDAGSRRSSPTAPLLPGASEGWSWPHQVDQSLLAAPSKGRSTADKMGSPKACKMMPGERLGTPGVHTSQAYPKLPHLQCLCLGALPSVSGQVSHWSPYPPLHGLEPEAWGGVSPVGRPWPAVPLPGPVLYYLQSGAPFLLPQDQCTGGREDFGQGPAQH